MAEDEDAVELVSSGTSSSSSSSPWSSRMLRAFKSAAGVVTVEPVIFFNLFAYGIHSIIVQVVADRLCRSRRTTPDVL